MSAIGSKLRVWRGRALSHPQLSDLVLGLVVTALVLAATVIGGDDQESRPLHGTDYTAAVAAAALIAGRRRWPLPVLALATLATAAATAETNLLPAFAAAALVCVYTVASTAGRAAAWSYTVVAATLVYLAAVLLGGAGWRQPESVSVLAWGGLATALGEVARVRRAYLEAVLERADRAERSREEEARRRVVEERLRIARELHDVVAHHIAMINVQAGVAAHVLGDQPDQARNSMAEVRRAARTVLEELSTVLGVLRAPGDPAEAAAEPPPGLNRLDDLLRTLTAAGLRVEHTQEGDARDLPAAVDHAAFRIVQEALTNAHKHGAGGTVRLCLAYTHRDVSIVVDNAQRVPPPVPAGTGYGLVGVRERATAVGGTVTADGDGAGTFRVRAHLPAPAPRSAP
ncbi:sensor histidine kinase [Jidongwangia harbinensis]|uniref:sensor histidine kinase n=1 Tax=Jidongwangia harbinensis TaxID=2878561 RepID=UPI001CD9898B|nr:histidine kinase [Jidongwangia harbinensis]MCA2218758.1 histidine kinase [Jidongwangia harbinensis]